VVNPFSSNAVIYAIGAPGGPIKVGMSRDPRLRAADLTTAPGISLLYSSAPILRADAYQVERIAHHLLASHRVQGEWFSASIEVIKAAIGNAITQYAETGKLPLAEKNKDMVSLGLTLPKGTLHAIDVWRGKQRPILNRSEAIRFVVSAAIDMNERRKAKAD